MIHLECYRVLINLLELNPPPEPPKPASTKTKGGDWDADVPDEGVLPSSALAERPPSPRSWEVLGMQPAQVSDMIVNICTMLVKEENAKVLRLARFGLGLLAYFACEKIENTVDSFYNGGVAQALEVTFANFETEVAITETNCYIINNVAFSSDQSMYALLRKEKTMRVNLNYSVKVISKGEKTSKAFCSLTEKLIDESGCRHFIIEYFMIRES